MTARAQQAATSRPHEPIIVGVFYSVMTLIGCGNDADIPHVVYPDQLPQPEPDHVFDVPALIAGEPPVDFTLSESAQAGWRLAFEGTLSAANDEDLPHAVIVLLEGRDARGVLFFNSSGTVLRSVGIDGTYLESEDGVYPYRVALEGPTTPGSYHATLLAGGGPYSGEKLAKGQLMVETSR